MSVHDPSGRNHISKTLKNYQQKALLKKKKEVNISFLPLLIYTKEY
ncbi:MAG: hypothetical protein CM15mP83_1690 [Flavobacteriaceae bacterium]|nr:MAG: hypothetical protein CM15mP83_1690 [Flavobacteriaceae bacterium]